MIDEIYEVLVLFGILVTIIALICSFAGIVIGVFSFILAVFGVI